MPKCSFFVVAIGTELIFWCCHEMTICHGDEVENMTSQLALPQLVKKSHFLDNSLSCIDLIFSSQPNLLSELRVYPHFHPNWHHQIVCAKFNLQFYYLSQNHREVWHYNDANTDQSL